MDLPYLTPDFPGIGGAIKRRPEDFFVQELPLYEPSGDGEHVMAEVQKIDLTTFELVNRIGRALNVDPRDIGFAGMKDRNAITRQLVSIPRVTEEAVMTMKVEGAQVMWAARHGNKLRLGHLRGNRFAVKIRHVDPMTVVKLRPVLSVLETRGLPNYFGEQRFGRRGDNDLLGAALVRGDNKQVLHLLLGNPQPGDLGNVHEARAAFDAGDFDRAMHRWPRSAGLERRILARFAKTRRPGATVRMIDYKLRNLWISALQSRLFNDVLAARVESLDKLLPGEMAMKEDNGACFHVADPAAEQARCDAWEISPTGPLIGYRLSLPTDAALAIEQGVFDKHGLKPDDFHKLGKDRAKGARRALRVKPTDIQLESGVDEHGAHVTVAFTLPAGSFATVLLRELMKPERHEPPPEDAAAGEGDASSEPEAEDSADMPESAEPTDEAASASPPSHPLGAVDRDDD